MRKFIFKSLLFIIIPVCLYIPFTIFILPEIFEIVIGPSVENQLDKSFKNAELRDYNLVVLGNSRLYCGINPDEFSKPTFNFSHNNDSYNQLYYKLLWLEKKNKNIDYLILGVDYFQFGIFSDTRNYVYNDYLGKEYSDDYPKKNYYISYYKDLMRKEKILALFKSQEGKHALKDNGQYVRYGIPKNEEFLKRDYSANPLQKKYFEKILDYCNEKRIKVFLVMPPLREAELNNYSSNEVTDFNAYLNKYVDNENVWYFNFSNDKSYKWNDFIDFTHLNQKAAERFSSQLNDSIQSTQ